MIRFKGHDSDEFGVVIEQYPARPIPKRKGETFQIPGRSGDVWAPEDAWENIKLEFEVYFSAEKEGLPGAVQKAAAWLMADDIPDPAFPETNYRPLFYPDNSYLDGEGVRDYPLLMARFEGGLDVKNIQNAFGRTTLRFDCWPQRFTDAGLQGINFSEYVPVDPLTNPTGFTAEPLITLFGSGEGTLTIGDYTITVGDCNRVVLDCMEEDAWRESDGSNLYSLVSGTFPKLHAGDNVLSYSGGITGVYLIPRWYWI